MLEQVVMLYRVVLVQRELDKSTLQLRDISCLRQEGFFRHSKALNGLWRSHGMADVFLPPQRPFVALGWVSLAGYTSAEPASVWPTRRIVVTGSIIVNCRLITMLSFGLDELLGRRPVLIHAEPGSFRLGLRVYPWGQHSRWHYANACYCNGP